MSKMVRAAKILSQKSYVVPGKLKITEHFFSVPLDWNQPDNDRTISLFARSAQKVEKPADPSEATAKQLPWMLFLQGGPGGSCGSPQNLAYTTQILDKGYQMLALDQRGTGLSSALSAATIQVRGDEYAQVDYLKLFRADSIVRDCEAIRLALTHDYPEEKKRWSVTGQSFGGFCETTYLSFFPEGLKEVFMFGGLPPMVNQPDEVYKRLYPRVIKRNQEYYEKYPDDVARVKQIVAWLNLVNEEAVKGQVPFEVTTTGRKFLQLGMAFGTHGGFDSVHELVLRATTDMEQAGYITKPTLNAIEASLPFDNVIIYSILHEPIYCQDNMSHWSASVVQSQFPEYDQAADSSPDPVYFTGEMIYPWMFDDYIELKPVKDVAERIASESSWPALYDEEQLANNKVPVYAAVYYDDMFVDFDFSMETANKIRGCKTYVTNAMYHNAIRAKTDDIWKEIWKLRDDTID